jgi:hypothetical protein
MCENMAICVKIWLSLDICVNVWKYGHLCEKFTFIGYFCEICSVCENMDVSEVCAVIWSLVFSFWWSVCFLAKQKGDTPTECVSHILVKGDVPIECASHILVKGDARCGGASPFYLICTQKRKPYRLFSIGMLISARCSLARIHQTHLSQRSTSGLVQEAPHGAQAIWNLRSKWPVVGLKPSEHYF